MSTNYFDNPPPVPVGTKNYFDIVKKTQSPKITTPTTPSNEKLFGGSASNVPYIGEVQKEQARGVNKIIGSVQQGAKTMQGTPLDFTQGKDYVKSFTPTKIYNAVIGAGEAGFGAFTGAEQTVLSPATPLISGITKLLTPTLRLANPKLAKVYDTIIPKVQELSSKIPPEHATLLSDILNTALLSFAVGKTEIPIKETFSKEGVASLASPLKTGAGKVTGAVKTGATNLKDIATSGKQLKVVQEELAGQPLQKLDISTQIKDVKNASKGTLQEMKDTFQTTNQVLQDTLVDEAKLQAAKNQGTLKTLFKDMSETYKSGLSQAEKEMAKRGANPIKDGFSKVIDDTLKTANDYGVDMNDSTIKALKEVQSSLIDGKPLTLDKMVVLKQKIYNASQMGKDFVNDEFMRNYGKLLEGSAPELKALNEEFGPMAQAKRWATSEFKPYNIDEIQKGADVLTQIATGKVPNQTSLNYLKTLEEGSGRFKGTGSLKGKTTEIGSEIKNTKGLFNLSKQDLINSTDFQINKLEREIASLQKRGIELGQRAEQLKKLKTIRNWVIGLTLTAVGGDAIKGTVLKAVNIVP